MNFSTLTLYLVAGGFSICLSAMMWRVAYLRLDTRLIKSWALAILMLSAGFIVSGFGPQLPRWVTVLGTNMMLLASGAVIFSGVRAFCEQQPTRFDRVGWSIVALTALPFWFWGLIEPDGHYRAVVFSFAAALINARTAHILLRTAHHTTWSTPRNRSTAILALIFSIVTLWMAVRGVHLLFAEPVVASLRGSNPTSWLTLFWYIVLVSVATLFIFWLEFGSQTPTRTVPPVRRHAFTGVTEYSRHKLQLLWVTVLVLVLGVVSEGVLYYAKSFEWEEQRLLRSAELTNDAFVQHTLQVMGQVDTILHAVRTVFVSTGSVAETEAFIHDLPFDKSTIDNVYLISAQGKLLIAHDTEARGISMADRDYFRFQQATHGDQLFLGAVELGRVTGKFHFRVVRRINHPDGRFAGVLLCTVNPEAFSRFYQNQSDGRQGTATLLGTIDRKVRARSPGPSADQWAVPVESPLWGALKNASSGSYRNISMIDRIERVYVYEKVPDLPLVIVTGFSAEDVRSGVHASLRWLVVGAFGILGAVLILLMLLRIEVRRRLEQSRFLSMLSHELKTPLSTIGMALSHSEVPDSVKLRIDRSVFSMSAVIDRCLQSDRLDSGGVEVAFENCDIAALAQDMRTACAAPERVAIEAGALPTIRTDRQLVSVILGNLIDNALKYGASGGMVCIKMSMVPEKGRARVLVEVSNRIGNAGAPDPRQVFRKYYRAPGAHGKIGSGLGLHIAEGFTRKIGGALRYQPTSEQVQFALWIPV